MKPPLGTSWPIGRPRRNRSGRASSIPTPSKPPSRPPGPLADQLKDYGQTLSVNEVSATYKANALRAIRRLIDELRLVKLSDFRRDKIEPWLFGAILEGMGARTRNYYRDACSRFLTWCVDTGRVREHDLHKLPKADERADPRRKRRALTEGELKRLLCVALGRPLKEARTIRSGKSRGELAADV